MAPELKLYGDWLSAAVMTVALTLQELEVDFAFVKVQLFKGEHKQPEYVAKNPFGVVPVLEDGDFKLFESGAIIRYLADTYPKKGDLALCGRTLAERAAVDQWLEASAHNFRPHGRSLIRQSLFSHLIPRDETKFQQSLKELELVVDVYESRLAESKYLAGDFFSLADLASVPALFHLVEHCPPVAQLIDSRPHVKAWWQDLSARPTWQKVAKECTAAVTVMQGRQQKA